MQVPENANLTRRVPPWKDHAAPEALQEFYKFW